MEIWNHNIHYHPLVVESVPAHAARGLDVGCGEGLLARRLRLQIPHVVGIDRHAPSIAIARDQSARDIDYIAGDFLTHPFAPASFDFIAAVASLHHMDLAAGLDRMRALLKPGGRLVAIGLARSGPADWRLDIAAMLVNRLYKLSKNECEDGAPRVRPAPLTYGQNRRIAQRTLPGAVYRRRLLWRYSLVFTRPEDPQDSIFG